MTTRLTIERLGEQGDGVARTESGPVFAPFTLPGETVTAAVERDRATLISVIEASPQRREPACRHFTRCGGCAIQHLDETAYLDWKRGRVVEALRRHGVDAPVADIVPCAPRTRRRVVFAARRTEHRILIGFNRALSTEIVDIEECPVTLDAIVDRRDDIRSVAALLCNTPRAFRIAVTATASGLDVALSGQGAIDDGARRAASGFALSAGFARLSCDGEIIVEPKKPLVAFGRIHVAPPPGGFLQATAGAEETMADLALGHLTRAKKVADLFSGAGAFTLRLAERAEVHAVEADAAALTALQKAVAGATGLKRITAERRDLDRRPLTAKELDAFDGVVFDPPRAGAEAQARQIARSTLPLVVAVSCNPATLGRDLAILVAGGYAVRSVTPIDQFLWSPHVEAVALLEKPRKRR